MMDCASRHRNPDGSLVRATHWSQTIMDDRGETIDTDNYWCDECVTNLADVGEPIIATMPNVIVIERTTRELPK